MFFSPPLTDSYQSSDNRMGAYTNPERKKRIWKPDFLRSRPIVLGFLKLSAEMKKQKQKWQHWGDEGMIRHLLLCPRWDWELNTLMNTAQQEKCSVKRAHLPLREWLVLGAQAQGWPSWCFGRWRRRPWTLPKPREFHTSHLESDSVLLHGHVPPSIL